MEDAFASLHEFSRAVAGALEEASSSEAAEADAEDAAGVALSRAVWELCAVSTTPVETKRPDARRGRASGAWAPPSRRPRPRRC